MANSRLNLHEELCEVLGNRNVYYNPPESIRMKYPCIRYTKAKPKTIKANNERYLRMECYTVTVMSTDPENDIADLLMDHFQYAEYDRPYNSDGIAHDVLTIYYHKEDKNNGYS